MGGPAGDPVGGDIRHVLGVAIPARPVVVSRLVLGEPAAANPFLVQDVEGPEHGDADAQDGQIRLESEEQDRRRHGTRHVAVEVDGADVDQAEDGDDHAGRAQEERSRHTDLVRLAHLETPDLLHGHHHDYHVADGVGGDQRLDHGDILATLANAGPLPTDGVADEDTGADIGNPPNCNDCQCDYGCSFHPGCREDSKEEAEHAGLGKSEKRNVDKLHAEGELEDKGNIGNN